MVERFKIDYADVGRSLVRKLLGMGREEPITFISDLIKERYADLESLRLAEDKYWTKEKKSEDTVLIQQ